MKELVTLDGNAAAATVAHLLNEVIAIYPITPSSPMAELCDERSAKGVKNIFGTVPRVVEMQSEAGAAGAMHGSLMAGALTTTFTSSQGLLLMIPDMYKIAGELLPAVITVAARSLAAQALSIFGDHQDVMAARATGFALLSSSSVQEAADFTAIAQMAAIESRVPVLHFFDGFRTSHEMQRISLPSAEILSGLIDRRLVAAFRERALTPDRPTLRGTAQNPDIYFQAREAANPYYLAFPDVLRGSFARFAQATGRAYDLFEYAGHPQAETVVTLMGSGATTAEETVARLCAGGERVGVVKTRLFRPFDEKAFNAAIPKSTKRLIALDRTKEPGSNGEPLYLEVLHALKGRGVEVFGGRYGLSSKEFSPAMVKAVFDRFRPGASAPPHGFTVGIADDVTKLSLDVTEEFDAENPDVFRAKFYGLGSDGSVGASKSTIKILGDLTGKHAQGYFVYDSKKAGAITISHVRLSRYPIRSAYLIAKPDVVAIHQSSFLGRIGMLDGIRNGGTVLLNTRRQASEAFASLPADMRRTIREKGLKLHVVDAHGIAEELGLKGRINTVMQSAFFRVSGLLPEEVSRKALLDGSRKAYARKGEKVVAMNAAAIERGFNDVRESAITTVANTAEAARSPAGAPEYVTKLVHPILAQKGDGLPVSAMPADGVFQTGGCAWEKRAIATILPRWLAVGAGGSRVCIQCNLCAFVCPHSAIRPGVVTEDELKRAPEGFTTLPLAGATDGRLLAYRIQLFPDDCTGCEACVEVCPGEEKDPATNKATGRRSLEMVPAETIRDVERKTLDFFLAAEPAATEALASDKSVKSSQYFKPLFEFSSACAGCGETPYIRLLTQLFGDRLYIANATGCSSIYGGTAPATPYTKDRFGRGPAWANSLFEDNAEFGLGLRLASSNRRETALAALSSLASAGNAAADGLLALCRGPHPDFRRIREAASALAEILKGDGRSGAAGDFLILKDDLVPKAVWAVGGDGWAYDIGYGGLDHVLASGERVKILVLDTQVYSNTGGQNSKSTPLGAVARFAASGKAVPRKKLALNAMNYGGVYVAQVCYGANPAQTLKSLIEAESYDGPAIVLAYSPCIEHGIDMSRTGATMKLAVGSGFWPLFRYDPRRRGTGEAPLKLDCKPPATDVGAFMESENRFRTLKASDPARYEALVAAAREDVSGHWDHLTSLAKSLK